MLKDDAAAAVAPEYLASPIGCLFRKTLKQ